MDPFDPSFAETMRMRLLAQKDQLDDPWCLGFFVDNEIKWGDTKSLASFTIKAPTTQRAKIAMINWLQKKYKTITTLNNHWGTTFGSWKELRANRKKVPTAANGDLTEFNKRSLKPISAPYNAFSKRSPLKSSILDVVLRVLMPMFSPSPPVIVMSSATIFTGMIFSGSSYLLELTSLL